MKIEGWFVPESEEDLFNDFYNERWSEFNAEYPYKSIGKYELKNMCKTILFGELFGDCTTFCKSRNRYAEGCSNRTSNFCKIQSAHQKKTDVFIKTNYYVLWNSFRSNLEIYEKDIAFIIGQARYDSFKEWLTHHANEAYIRFTNREINENNYEKPEAYIAPFLSLDQIGEDPWQKFTNNKIKTGGEEWSQQFADLDLFALQ